jgi:hypothetical protein
MHDTRTRDDTHRGIDPGDRQQILLDDLRVEITRLADAVERQNELIEARAQERAPTQVDP